MANAFKSFTELITGKKSSGQTGASGAGLVGTDPMADTADQYGDAADNAEKLIQQMQLRKLLRRQKDILALLTK